MKKLTNKQEDMLNNLNDDISELGSRMLSKIYDKTLEGVSGWDKMGTIEILNKAGEKLEQAFEGEPEQIVDAMNYLLFAWIKAGKP